MDLKGRSFLKLLDFTPEEIVYLVDLAQDLKEKRKKGIRGNSLKDKNIALIFENRLPEPDVHSPSGHRKRVLWQLTLQEVNCSLVKKRVSKIQPVYWEECLMVSNTVALTILMWKSWLNTVVYLSGTD